MPGVRIKEIMQDEHYLELSEMYEVARSQISFGGLEERIM